MTFAFLAACNTAEQSLMGLQDEILHLTAAIQFIGFRGTMWAMKDRDGPLCSEEILFGDAQSETVIGHGAAQALGPLGRLVT